MKKRRFDPNFKPSNIKLKLGDSDKRLENSIRSLKTISDSTKTLYISKLNTLKAAVKQQQKREKQEKQETILESIAKPPQSYAALTSYRIQRKKVPTPIKPMTAYVVMSVIIALFKHFPSLKTSMPPNTRLMWRNIVERTSENSVGRYEDLKPTEEQIDSYIPFERIIEKRDQLIAIKDPTPKERVAILVLSLYSMFPPRRSIDWAIAAVIDSRKPSESKILDRKDIDEIYPNRVVIFRKKGTLNGIEMFVTFTKYKTAKIYGRQRFQLPPPLVRVIINDLKNRPRRYLFEKFNSTTEPMVTHRFSELVQKVLKAQFPDVKGAPSISMLRHSYIIAADVGNITPRVAYRLAKQMGHSRLQQLVYAYNVENKDKDPDEHFDIGKRIQENKDKKNKKDSGKGTGTCRLVCDG